MTWRPPLLPGLNPVPEASLEQTSFLEGPFFCLRVLVCLCTHGLSHGAATCLAARRAHPLSAGARAPVCTWTAACAWDGSTTSWPDQLGTQGDTEHRMHTGPTKVADHRKRTGFQMSQLTRSALVGPNVAVHRMHTGLPNVAVPLYVSRNRSHSLRLCACPKEPKLPDF